LSDSEIAGAREARSQQTKNAAALKFAREIVAKKGHASEADVQAVRAAGFSDGEVAEIIANVALNVFTNYFNSTTAVEVDFPKIALHHSA
jgi:alkylhydroperoxidase family enzyme